MNYTVPADAAKILESQPKPELLPFLAKLRMEPPPWKAGIVDEWITIVRDGLHGRPGVITGTLTTTKAVASTNEIPIYTFSEHFGRRAQNIPLDVRAALLASAKKNGPDFPDGRNLVLTHFAEVGSLVTLLGDNIYVIDQYSVTADAMAPHGQAFIVFFDNKFRFLGKIGYGRSSPLWCDGGKLYLRGDLDRKFYNSDLDKHLENISPGNVIDVAEGFENLTNYQAKVYGSSGGLDDK